MNRTAAYEACESITRREARNFSYGIRLLPEPKRQALSAIYAAARQIDDIGDGDLPDEEKSAALAYWHGTVTDLTGERSESAMPADPVLYALVDAAQRFPIPLAAFHELIDGCEADVSGRSYQRFEQLVGYCRCVAGSVGRLSLGVYDPVQRVLATPLADALGVALQLTNILRDLREDRLSGRVYLPQEDLDRFGCSLSTDSCGDLSDPPERLSALVRFEVERTEEWYERGLCLLPLLDWRSAACTAAMAGIYHRLLRRIAADPAAVARQRLSLSTGAKTVVAARALARRS